MDDGRGAAGVGPRSVPRSTARAARPRHAGELEIPPERRGKVSMRADHRPGASDQAAVADLADHGLPFNRKERFFTGTVLPAIVTGDNFSHLGRLLELCGLTPSPVHADGVALVQFFTEYGFTESLVKTRAASERFPGSPRGKDTPDLMVYTSAPPARLLAIEAKVYDRPSAAQLNEQLGRQRPLVKYLVGRLGVGAGNWARTWPCCPSRWPARWGR